MTDDSSRDDRTACFLERDGYDGIVCRLPQNVVMLTGYCPVLGNSFCVVSRGKDGRVEIRLAVPADDEDLIPAGTAMTVSSYTEETLDRIGTTLPAVQPVLGELLEAAGLKGETVGYEGAPTPVAPAYTQIAVPSVETVELYRRLLPQTTLRDASSTLEAMATIKTEAEIVRIRDSITVAQRGFTAARQTIRAGATEADVAAATLSALVRSGHRLSGAGRLLPQVHVMSGPRAANAYRAFNLTSDRTIKRGDTVLVQMEVGLDGYWAELTRTFFAGDISDFWAGAHRACVRAQDAALEVIRDEAIGCRVDRAAREVLEDAGLGDAFKHGLGHGVGFQAINHAARPKLHPVSEDVLRPGMVHNLEPAVYVDGHGGLRLNDNVAVLRDGAELLSEAIPRELDWLVT